MNLKLTHFSIIALTITLLSLPLSVSAKRSAKATQAKPAAHQTPSESKAKKKELVKHLETMHVRGDRIKAVIAQLRVIRAALNRPLSNDPADADKLVCRLELKTGSHFKHFLFCGTNRERIKQRDDLRRELEIAKGGGGGKTIPTVNADYSSAFRFEVDASRLRRLLNMLPPVKGGSNHQ